MKALNVVVIILLLVTACSAVESSTEIEQNDMPVSLIVRGFSTDWDFMGFVDPTCYEHDLKKQWTPELLHQHTLESMNKHEAFFWGCAEMDWNLVINPNHFEDYEKKASKTLTGYIHVRGNQLVLTSMSSLCYAAQYPEEVKIPTEEDVQIDISPGIYRITVLELFDYDGSEQLPSDVDPDFDDQAIHYAIRIEKTDAQPSEEYTRIPLLPSCFQIQ